MFGEKATVLTDRQKSEVNWGWSMVFWLFSDWFAKQELVSHLGTYEVQKNQNANDTQIFSQECAKEEFTHHIDIETNSRSWFGGSTGGPAGGWGGLAGGLAVAGGLAGLAGDAGGWGKSLLG